MEYEKGVSYMGSFNYLQIDFQGSFAKEVRKTHYRLVTKIEEAIGKSLPSSIGQC